MAQEPALPESMRRAAAQGKGAETRSAARPLRGLLQEAPCLSLQVGGAHMHALWTITAGRTLLYIRI